MSASIWNPTEEIPADVDGAGTRTNKRFVGTATNDTGTPDAVFKVSRELDDLTIGGGHGFRDETIVTGSVEDSGYCAFDAAPTIEADDLDHVVSFQSRPQISGNILHVYGVTHRPTLNAGGHAINSYAGYAFDGVGAGTVENMYGYYVPQLTKGSVSNYPLYIAQQGAHSFVGSPIDINNILTIDPSAPFILGGATTLGYPFAGYNYDPITDNKRVNDVAITCKFSSGGFQVYTKPTGAPVGSGTLATMNEGLRIDTAGAAYLPATLTTASAANAFIDNGSSNKILRSTSSIRYKTAIETISVGQSSRIWDLRPVRYRSLATADNSDWSFYGLIAEEVALVEPRLVHWTKQDDKQVPDGVQYERLVVLLLAETKRLLARVEVLEAAIKGK